MIHYASFRYDGENYLAAGETENYLAVFVETSPGQYVRNGKTRWPSWAKFMHGDVDNYEEGSVSDIEELERRYGAFVPAGRAVISERRDVSRWTDNPFTPSDASPELLEWYDKRDEAIRVWRETGDDTMAIEIGLFPSKEEEKELEEEEMEANEEPGSQMSALNDLEADPNFTQLRKMLAEFDALELLGVSRDEETHSDVLAWLLNPREKHLMGDHFLKKFFLETKVATVEQLRDTDWSNTEVQREWHHVVDGEAGRLDILVLNEDAEFACAIENKVFSGEHSEQLTRYRKALKHNYGRFQRSHMFLTRHGDLAKLAEEQKSWTPVDYGTVLRLVEETEETLDRGQGLENDKVLVFLRQYATTLRRRIVPETEMRRSANNLYLRHREAIDLIVKQKEAHIADLSRICREVTEKETCWELIGEREGGKLLCFVEPSWKHYEALQTGTNLGKQSDSLLVLDFDFRKFGEVTLILTMMDGSDDDVRKSLYARTQGKHPRVFDHRGDWRGGSYRKSTIRLYASEPILSGNIFIQGDRASWHDAIVRRVSEFAENELKDMNEIILASLKEIEGKIEYQPAPKEST